MAKFDYTSEYFLKISRRCHYNERMAEFYETMADLKYDEIFPLGERDRDRAELFDRIANSEFDLDTYPYEEVSEYTQDLYFKRYSKDYRVIDIYLNRAKSIRLCMRFGWVSDYYRMNGVKVVKSVNRCRDRFCYNCQSMDALQRFHEYAPFIDSFSKDYDIYHVVFSQPNVPGFILSRTLDLMNESFSRFVKFMSGNKKIKGLDLVGMYGFAGAVRALEVSQNDDDRNYHPHFHCMVALKKGIDTTPKHRNMFSKDRTHRREDRLFSDFEVFLQRIWYLLMNGIKVTKKNIEQLPQICGNRYSDGFSCYAENADGHYHEIFKYATKGSFKNRSILNDFECFRTLYEALYGRRIYQASGCFYNKNVDFNVIHDGVNLQDMADVCFNEILQMLDSMEKPERIVEDLKDILKMKVPGEDKEGIIYLSAQSVRFAFDELPDEEKGQVKEKLIRYIWDRCD